MRPLLLLLALSACTGGEQSPFLRVEHASGRIYYAHMHRTLHSEAGGFLTNQGFSGFSTFGSVPYAEEFPTFLLDAGPRPMIMCHPGFPDAELGDRDSIAARRPEERGFLAIESGLPELIWRPATRDAAGFPWAGV